MRDWLVAVLLSTAMLPAMAGELRPLWELGIGPTALALPDYRGSDETRGYLYPFPYIIYRGPRLRVDRQGLRGIFFESDRVELDVSMYATPPVDSAKNRARAGMPDLDPTIEIGPLVNITLARDPVKEWRLDLRLPVRAVIATDFTHAQTAGYVFYPHVNLDANPTLRDAKWKLGLQAGPLFATGKYHRYFYGVDAEFASAERPPYAAPGGYSGAAAVATLSRRFRRFWVGAFVRYDHVKGAVFADSPLVKRDQTVLGGVAFAWVFAESERKVDVPD